MYPEHEYSIRPLRDDSDYTAFESLQREIWGEDIAEVVSGALAKIVQKIGGIAAGAFNSRNELVGLVFGFTGVRDGRPVHWSHMLAVKEGHRNAGVGVRLKLYQRKALLDIGVHEIYWTYDPLVAKNAQLNFNILGAGVLEYSVNMYGTGEDSKLFRGIGTDRFVVVWHIGDEKVVDILEKRRRFDRERFKNSPLAVWRAIENDRASLPASDLHCVAHRVRVEIPPDVYQLMSTSLSSAAAWRNSTREVFQQYLMNGYKVVGFYCEETSGRCFYCMEHFNS